MQAAEETKMTNLSDFLKFEKVKCVEACAGCLTVGKEYSVLDIRMEVKVKDDEGDNCYWESDRFEPVLESAENPLQEIELTPELETEASEPKFKVGDKVYCSGFSVLFKVLKVANTNGVLLEHCAFEGGMYADAKYVCHATPENYELLCKLYPHIEFERPPKPLSGIELAKKLIAKGHNYLVVDTVIGIRVLTRLEGNTLIDSNNVRLDELDDITPLDDETGEPLTESILND